MEFPKELVQALQQSGLIKKKSFKDMPVYKKMVYLIQKFRNRYGKLLSDG